VSDAESHAKAMLASLEREYRERAAPWIKVLTEIEAMRPRSITVPVGALEFLRRERS